MDQYYLNLLFIGGSFLLYIGIAVWARAGSTDEFYAAGRGIHPVTNGMATAADWMSAASFISMAGLLAFNGYSASSYLMGWTGGYVLLALCLAPYLRKFGSFTVPEFIGDRYYSSTARLVAVLCLIVASLTYVIGQMTGVGVAFSRFLQVENSTGLFIGAAVVFFYAVLGGMKGVTYTQVAQYVVLVFAYTVPAIFISLQLTGNPVPGLGLFSNFEATGEPILTTLNATLADLGFASYTEQDTSFLPILNMTLFTLTLMIGTAGLPHVIIRFFTVPKVSDARLSAGWALLFIAIVYLTAPAVGAMARLNIMDTIWPGGAEGEAMLIEEAPPWFENWQTTGLLGLEDANGDGRLQYFNEDAETLPPVAEASGAETNELVEFNRDILVLANPEIAQLPSWVIALVAAGGMAAALSTAAGLLLAISSAVSHDLLKRTLTPGISEKGELLAARISMAAAVAVATWLGLNPPGFAAQTVALAFGIAAATIFPALLMGIFSKRISNVGAVAGMVTGLVFTVVYIFLHKGWFFVPGTNSFPDTIEGSLFGIESTAIGCVGAALNFIVAFVVSGRTADTPDDVKAMIENVRIPRGAGGASSH
ncbi:Cation/acetate symporter ActP [Rhodobacteraceae bacterium THAF1]|uniref:sodium:solute symporter family protein n=1 Tax=Palleronia sp. THAF1 TaxID=2587842 RepID=UPI000F3FAEFE|nr:sodium:solute symporter family protein [Palleronia sp. THAF1]QFU09839.1 Cation/acetate symporter ActP [Palleronia sp. THAF1]VDC17258.1 Cation/acetate symporter ActP [Rhodobacteraceae bacterium THAF1]